MVSGHAVGAEAATEAAQVQATTDQPVDEAKEEPELPEPNGEYPDTKASSCINVSSGLSNVTGPGC